MKLLHLDSSILGGHSASRQVSHDIVERLRETWRDSGLALLPGHFVFELKRPGVDKGGAIAELVSQHHPVPMRILGVPSFAPTGDTQFLLNHFGLNASGLAKAVRELLRRDAP